VGLPTEPGYKPNATEKIVVASGDRTVSLIMPPDEFDIGVDIRLQYFERKLDPGTSQPSHYSSMVDILQEGSGKVLSSDVWITMNAPVDFTDPESSRSYRLFQESFQGPFHPWDDIYGARVSDPVKEELFRSVLTVNYDPGRGIKYAGCLLIVGGIATMFYMRAYFFTPAVQRSPSRAKSVDKREQHAQATERLAK